MYSRIIGIIGLAILLGACSSTQQPVEKDTPSTTAGLTLPDGFGAEIVADELGRVRHIAVRENGDLYVKLDKLKDGK
ncbi:MAG: sorbosone dehydrogenase, partial [Bacteroidota bacterium]